MSANGKKSSPTKTTKSTVGLAPVPGAQPLAAAAQAAAGGWFSCNVNMTGPGENGDIYVHLREVSGRFDQWYVAAAAVKKEILATALTAISASLHVSCYLTTTDQYGTINRLFVVR
jgi:hypothetical protein